MPDPGRLEVICGPMFSGKTAELIRRLTEAANSGQTVVAVKPAADTRYTKDALATHHGVQYTALGLRSAGEIPAAAPDSPVVGIDEAHFFGPTLTPICRELVAAGRRVIVAGVERDHRGHPFEPFPSLLCEADEVTKLSGPCAVCGKPAIHSQRMTADAARVVVGGPEMYQARCRACFQPGA